MVNGKTILLVLAIAYWCGPCGIIMKQDYPSKITGINIVVKTWIIPFAKQINPCVDAVENAKLCSKET